MRARFALLFAATLTTAACKKQPDPAKEGGPTPAVSSGTVFRKVLPSVGSKREESSDMTMSVAMRVDVAGRNQNVDMIAKEIVKHVDEVLAVNGDAITKEKVTFGTVAAKRTEAGKEKSDPSPVSGKTYVVESKDGKIDVRDENGKGVSGAEEKDVRKQLKSLGKADPMFAALPQAALVPGQKVDAIAKALTEQLKEESEETTVKDVVVTFKEQRGEDGVFAVALKLTKEEGPMAMEIDVTGEALVSTKTGWPTKMSLAGPIHVGPGKASALGMNVSGSGKMAMQIETKSL
jgi:hypothetical protein